MDQDRTPDAPTPTGPARALGALVGRWRTEGRVVGDPAVRVVGTDTYEWAPGGQALVHHVDVMVGDEHVRAIEMIGEHDAATGSFTARAYDHTGAVTTMRATVDGAGVWTFTGGGDVAPAAGPGEPRLGAVVRATLTVAPGGGSMAARWERTDDGTAWQPWMEIGFTREEQAAAPGRGVRQLRMVVETDDFEEAAAFYRDAVGLREQAAFEGDGDARVVILEAGRATLELANPAQSALVDGVEVGRTATPRIRLALEVDDARSATERLAGAGAALLGGPVETPWRSLNARLATPGDLQVTLFEELEPLEERQDRPGFGTTAARRGTRG